ncbi:MAG TPA: hypothetical protein VEH27_07075 [Methylomirabilota bacterium]|nr:hypothetical protein [Methylomirabilota bacterium]
MRRTFQDKMFKPLMAAIAITLVIISGFAQRKLNQDREALELTRTTVLENAPPVLAFTTVALGGFRGLIANALWIRMTELQEDGKYFEMFQLSDWITKLQPTFTSVWVHQAWNMSYNISIKFTDPRERWTWVKRGIELLRDDGLRYNPGEPLMYRELAWHFQHKLGHYLDDAHNEYKRYWAEEFWPIVGADGRPNYQALLNPQTQEQKEAARLLKEKFKMDAAVMQEVDAEYGPLEWRLPETHAIYWGYYGLRKTEQNRLKREDIMQLRRTIFQSMQLAFHRGRLVFPSPQSKDFTYGPNLEIVRKVNESYLDMMAKEPERAETIRTSHRNFLKTAVYFFYTHNRLKAAEEWFAYVKQQYPQMAEVKMDLDTYAFSRINEDIGETDPNRVKSVLEGLLETSIMEFAMGQDETMLGYENLARKLWTRYTSQLVGTSQKRVAMDPLPKIRDQVLERMLNPEYGLNPVLLAQLRQRLNLPPATNAPPAAAPVPANAGAGLTNAPAAAAR